MFEMNHPKRLAGSAAQLFFLVLILSVSGACRNDTVSKKAETSPVTELTWEYPSSPFGPTVVAVAVPKSASSTNRMPVLIALHGQGEARKMPAAGARGWFDDYSMLRAFSRLMAPPLNRDDFGGMVDDVRLDILNGSLKKKPYRGVIVVCPYLPDKFRSKHLYEDSKKYSDFLIRTVLPRVYKETAALGTVASTGIDGVSLGGRASVIVGLTHPETFGAVGGTQAAFRDDQVEETAALVSTARKKNPKLAFRLISSDGDRFKGVTLTLSAALKLRNEAHQVDIVKGDHSYEFNRGPGGLEMLLYYDSVLRGEPFL
jgi:enterochelin esterase-like enzyme